MIELEPFAKNGFRRLCQAIDLSQLVDVEREWLQDVQPGTLSRYEKILGGIHNIRLGAQRRSRIEASVVRRERDKAAIGIATIIFDQQIVHPSEGTFRGDDIDFWLRRGEMTVTHHEVVRRLLSGNNQRPAFATVRVGHPNPAQGFEVYMDPVGEPASLSTGDREDKMGVAWEGTVAQLYKYPPEG